MNAEEQRQYSKDIMRRTVSVDFIDNYYSSQGIENSDGYDIERARQKAISVVLPLIFKNELTPKQTMCLNYAYIHHKSQKEIADILKISQPTVSRHIHSAKKIVNNELKYCYLAVMKSIEEYEKLSNQLQ